MLWGSVHGNANQRNSDTSTNTDQVHHLHTDGHSVKSTVKYSHWLMDVSTRCNTSSGYGLDTYRYGNAPMILSDRKIRQHSGEHRQDEAHANQEGLER
jgi:hypothetical protein